MFSFSSKFEPQINFWIQEKKTSISRGNGNLLFSRKFKISDGTQTTLQLTIKND